MKVTHGTVKKEIERRLVRHPGDAPWSCVDCYHGRPCIDKEILLAALRGLRLARTLNHSDTGTDTET